MMEVGDIIKINNNEYRLHPYYNLFGADELGNVISIITKQEPKSNSTGSRIKVKSNKSNLKVYDKLVFIYECFNGIKPKDKAVIHLSDTCDDDNIDNLQLIDISKRDAIIAKRWKDKPWTCSECGFETTNNASMYHKKKCISGYDLSDEEYQRMREIRKEWRNRKFECTLCGGTYKNNYKTVHTLLCKRKFERIIN